MLTVFDWWSSYRTVAQSDIESDEFEQNFHGAIREYTVCLLLFVLFYSVSYCVIRYLRRRPDADELCGGDEEDLLVHRISLWICTFATTVSIGSILLLPFSILSNEVLRLNPNSYYLQWLNSSLIQNLWNHVFLASNSSLFLLLPFSYFFIESQGFSGLRKGIVTRVMESIAVCLLFFAVVFCLGHIMATLLSVDSRRSLFNIWSYELPFVYSCVSFVGVIMLIGCTPFGYARMFTFVGNLLVKPRTKSDIDSDLLAARLEAETLLIRSRVLRRSAEQNSAYSQSMLLDHEKRTRYLRKRSCLWFHYLKYPLVMLLLLALTVISVLMVINNALQLMVGFRSLPSYKQYIDLGSRPLSVLGWYGSVAEVVIILYTMVASIVGLYGLPCLRKLKPRQHSTSMTTIIVSCAALVVLSSALPVLARTLGISSFDLLGAYGRIDWLSSLYLVCGYNVVFIAMTVVCLGCTFTGKIRTEIVLRLNEASMQIRRQTSKKLP